MPKVRRAKAKGKAKARLAEAFSAHASAKAAAGLDPKQVRQRERASEAARRKKSRRGAAARPRPLYSREQRILLVGEANFSFACALSRLFDAAENVVATTLDSREVTEAKYPRAAELVAEVSGRAAEVRFEVDATALHEVREWAGHFDVVVFNFPHTGSGEKDTVRNVDEHRELLARFLASAKEVLRPAGEVHVTVKRGEPYDQWRVGGIAERQGFRVTAAVPFYPETYPGYAHRRTIGYREGHSDDASAEVRRAGAPRTWCLSTPEAIEARRAAVKAAARARPRPPGDA